MAKVSPKTQPEQPLHAEAVAIAAAVDKLIALLLCGNPRVEISAARTILAFNNKLAERDLEARVKALSDDIKAWRGGR